jgi:hypothetical protein
MMTTTRLFWMFCFQLEGIGLMKRTRGLDYMEDDNPIFRRPIGLMRWRRP